MIKVVLFDADGVALVKHGYFSDRLSSDYRIPTEKIVPFFKNEFRTCQLGKADLKHELAKYLTNWNWNKSVDEFLDYWFRTDTITDEEVLVRVQQFRTKGIKCYLVTDQEKYRAEYIRKNLGFDSKFDDCFFSYEVGYSKADPEFFRSVLNRLDARPEEVLYFDDEEKNVQNALSLDITAKLYSDLKDLELFNMPTKTAEFIERLLEMNDSFNKMSANKAQLPFESPYSSGLCPVGYLAGKGDGKT